ncbi:MAG: hypothetical protein J0H10_09175 [Alphaproteobacteria bacterium]|nr:hypothetical protein [Alphaproteobacteria bacterium]
MDQINISKIRHCKHHDLHLFKRESGIWFAGFHRKGQYFRKSTGSDNLKIAMDAGEDWYLNCIAAIRLGQFNPKPHHSIQEASSLALERFSRMVQRGEKSPRYLNGVKLILHTDVLPFFGKTAVTNVGPAKWSEYLAHLAIEKPKLTRETLHQHRNALRLCLNEAVQREWISSVPALKIPTKGKKDAKPRTWFEIHELRLLLKAALKHMRAVKGTRHYNNSAECYDLMIWLANTGMRVGEARNVRFCDVEVQSEQCADGITRRYCLIRSIRGKRGTGECRSWYGAYNAFKRIVARRNILDPEGSEEKLFLSHHTDLLNALLAETDLKFTDDSPPRRRDFMSFRHTYIAHRLINGVNVYDIAANCRTSVAMIENHYARFLSPRYLTSLNRSKAITKIPQTHSGVQPSADRHYEGLRHIRA